MSMWSQSLLFRFLVSDEFPLSFFSVVAQLLSCVQIFATPWTAACQASMSFINSQSLLKLVSIELVMLSNPSHPLPPSFPFAFHLPSTRVFFQWVGSSGGQSIGALASASVFTTSIQGWFPLGLTGLISLLSKGPSRVSSSTTMRKHQLGSAQLFLWSNSHSPLCYCKYSTASKFPVFKSKQMIFLCTNKWSFPSNSSNNQKGVRGSHKETYGFLGAE